MALKIETTILTDIISVLSQGIAQMNINGFVARQAAQPFIATNTTPSFLVDIISAPRYGWQHQVDKTNKNDELIHHELFYQEMTFQITALKKKTAVKGEITAIDAINLLACYLNSDDGVNAIRERGYGVLKISEIRTGYYVSDSELFERSPNFDLTINFRQEVCSEIANFKSVISEVKGV